MVLCSRYIEEVSSFQIYTVLMKNRQKASSKNCFQCLRFLEVEFSLPSGRCVSTRNPKGIPEEPLFSSPFLTKTRSNNQLEQWQEKWIRQGFVPPMPQAAYLVFSHTLLKMICAIVGLQTFSNLN